MLIELYPRLFHMATDGSWPSIKEHGLLSTAQLVELWEVAPDSEKSSILAQRRPVSRVLTNPRLGSATIRDQKPLDEASLSAALIDMSVADWYRTLNDRVFFFLQRERLRTLLNARSYKSQVHTILEIDTAKFIANYEGDVELSRINSGFAQPHSKAPRGRFTFTRLADYSHRVRVVAPQRPPWDIAELCVAGAVLDIGDYIISVRRMQRDMVIESLIP